jgi:hypothetical protein
MKVSIVVIGGETRAFTSGEAAERWIKSRGKDNTGIFTTHDAPGGRKFFTYQICKGASPVDVGWIQNEVEVES